MIEKILGLDFEQTCGACPEQYDVFDSEGQTVGYVRLRWGNLTCEYPDSGGKLIYSHGFSHGLGMFKNDTERDNYLRLIATKINQMIENNKQCGFAMCCCDFDDGVFGSWTANETYKIENHDVDAGVWHIRTDNNDIGTIDDEEFKEFFTVLEEF